MASDSSESDDQNIQNPQNNQFDVHQIRILLTCIEEVIDLIVSSASRGHTEQVPSISSGHTDQVPSSSSGHTEAVSNTMYKTYTSLNKNNTTNVKNSKRTHSPTPVTSAKSSRKQNKPESERLPCGECGRTYSTRGNLNRHFIRCHGKDSNVVSCEDKGQNVRNESLLHSRPELNQDTSSESSDKETYDKESSGEETSEEESSESEGLSCGECGRTYSTRGNLNRHLKSCHGKDSNFVFSEDEGQNVSNESLLHSRPELNQDTSSESSDTETYDKESSGEETSEEESSESEGLSCGECGRTYSTRGNLNRHLSSCHGKASNFVFSEDEGQNVSNESLLHSRPELNQDTSSESSDKESYDNESSGEEESSESEGLSCGECGRTYSTRGNLNRHLSSCHGKASNFVSAEDEGQNVSNESLFHSRPEPKKETSSESCDKESFDEELPVINKNKNTNQSILHYRPDPNQETSGYRGDRLLCELCDKLFKNKRFLKYHFDVWHDVKRASDFAKLIPCGICEDTCENLDTLEEHLINDHNINKEYVHNKIKQSFGSTLNQKTQNPVRAYECGMCADIHKNLNAFERHLIEIHSIDKEYVRNKIKKSFGSTLNWKKETDLYKCGICKMTHKQLDTLAGHERKYHNIDKEYVLGDDLIRPWL